MSKSTQILKQLVALSIAAGSGLLDPSSSLARIPREQVEGAIAEVDEQLPAEERRRVLELLAHDPRPSVRARLAEVLVTLWPEPRLGAQEVLRRLLHDESEEVRTAAGRGLWALLVNMAPIDQLELVCRWVVADSPEERLALALALRSNVRVFASDLVLEQLAFDAEIPVRRAALDAIAHRFHENPDHYRAVAKQLLHDGDGDVRARARAALEEDVSA